jgi:uncharacterized protein DUF1840
MITFKTEFYSNIDMFDDIALELLKMMGHSPAVPGAILAEDVQQALENLKHALAATKPSQPAKLETLEDEDSSQDKISVQNRAFPLIELLTAAANKQCDVMWDKTRQFTSS